MKRQKERQADAKSKFNQLKALARGAVERLRPLLEGQGLSITSPAYVSKMRGLDRLSYHVGRDERRIVAVLSVVLRKDCMIEIENEPAAYEFNDPILTEDFFYDRFAGSIAGALDAQNSPVE